MHEWNPSQILFPVQQYAAHKNQDSSVYAIEHELSQEDLQCFEGLHDELVHSWRIVRLHPTHNFSNLLCYGNFSYFSKRKS